MAKKSNQGAAAAAAPAPEKPEKDAKPAAPALVKQNGVTQPREGGKTRKVWDIADYLRGEAGGNCPYLDDVRTKVEEYNAGPGASDPVGKGTVDANFLLWRKFHGLKAPGRKPAPKPETAAAE